MDGGGAARQARREPAAGPATTRGTTTARDRTAHSSTAGDRTDRTARTADPDRDLSRRDMSRLERDAAERVLRRAVELDGPDDGDHRITVQALLDAADELGIDRAEVRRAVVEEELGLLAYRTRRTDALLGPERFVVARVLDGTPAELDERVDGWLRRGRVLRRSRRSAGDGERSGWTEYARRTDPLAATQRAARAARGDERLAHVRRVRVVVSPLDERRCVVGMAVDASRSRRQAAAAGTAVGVTGALASSGLWFQVAPALGLVGIAASAAAGVGVMLGRRAYTGDVADELEAVMDSVATGARPPSVIDGVTERLLRNGRG